jgi:hypothetical protein
MEAADAAPRFIRGGDREEGVAMLRDFDHGGRTVTQVPFQSEFNFWKSRMKATDIAAIKADIHFALSSGEVHTTSWMPGPDWTGTPYDAIYWDGTKQDHVAAAKCFGLFVMECVLEREAENWGSGHYEKDGYPIKGRTYFRLA